MPRDREPLHSAIYRGRVRHSRHGPRRHEFGYAQSWLYLDLDELPLVFRGALWSLERWNLISFRRRDYLGPPNVPLREAVLARVESELGRRPAGAVRLLTHARRLGWVFNPVSFYFCFAGDGRLDAVVAEITNTPWNERHAYVLDFAASGGAAGEARSFTFDKRFHVSPFLPMEQRYTWTVGEPAERLTVNMRNEQDSRVVFAADLELERRPLSAANRARLLLRHPLGSYGVWLAIHLQALRLWLKRTPFHVHPRKRTAPLCAAPRN